MNNFEQKRRPLSAEEADVRIRDFEERYDLLQYRVDGWCVWPLLRFPVSLKLRNFRNGDATRPQPIRFQELLHITCDTPRFLWPREARYLAKTYNVALRTETQNGLYKDIYMDDLLAVLRDVHKIETVVPHFRQRSDRAWLPRNSTPLLIERSASILSRFGGPAPITKVAAHLSTSLTEGLELTTYTTDRLVIWLRHFYWAKRLYGWLIQQVAPRFLFLYHAYGEHRIIAAAKERGVTVVEFQHGFLNRHHLGYSWTEYARPYQGQMPIPDALFLYGEYWKQELTENGFWGDALMPVGSLNLDAYRQVGKETKSEGCTARHLVLTTQNLDTERLIGFMQTFLELVSDVIPVQLTIKMHPAEAQKDRYHVAFKNYCGVTILAGQEEPTTYELLQQADVHLSISSTCHFEALALGTPTVILGLVGHESVLHLYYKGHATLVVTPQELHDFLLQDGDRSVAAFASEFYFRPGALEQMQSALQALS